MKAKEYLRQRLIVDDIVYQYGNPRTSSGCSLSVLMNEFADIRVKEVTERYELVRQSDNKDIHSLIDKNTKLQEELEKNKELKKCPFCKQNDFDNIGLKHHLQNHCEEYYNTKSL